MDNYSVNYFKALSDETRLRMINLLIGHELNVNEIVILFGMGQSRISRHLKILTDSGLVKQRRDGLWVFYTAVTEGQGRDFLNGISPFFSADPALSGDLDLMTKKIDERALEKIEYFDSIAQEWDDMRRDIFGESNYSERIGGMLEKTGVVADIGCGTGDLIPLLKKFGSRVIGVDKSTRMLEIASSRTRSIRQSVELRLGGIEHLPMRDNEIGGAVINMVLHHLASPGEAVSEIGRVISAGGILIILDLVSHKNEDMRKKYNHRWLGFDSAAVESWLTRAKFNVEEREIFTVNHGLSAFIIKCRKQ